MFDYSFLIRVGIIIAGIGIGITGAGFLRHFIDLRTLIPRLFDEYKKDQIQETLKKFDTSLNTTSKLIFIGISIFGLGLIMFAFGLIFVLD
jgi:hypothetical protein